MVETGSKQQSQFEILQLESKMHQVDIEQLAVARLTTLSQMQEFLEGFADSLNLSHDPGKGAEFLERAKSRIRLATEDHSYSTFLRWSTFLNTGALSGDQELLALRPVRQPRQARR